MKNKKDLLGGVIIIALLLLVLVTYMAFYNNNKNEEKLFEENKMKDKSLTMINVYNDYSTLKIEDRDKIDTSKIVIGSYNCKADDCEVYKEEVYGKKNLVIKENKDVFVYDFLSNKVVSERFDDIVDKFEASYFITKKDGKYGLINMDGIEIADTKYDEFYSEGRYNSYTKIRNGKLYGILDLDNGDIILDTKYSDLKITDSRYYAIKKDDLWYVIDSEENILTSGYEYVYPFSKGFVALVDNNLVFYKYNKDAVEYLTEDVIPVYEKDKFSISRNGSTLFIVVNNQDVSIQYEYTINRNSLVNK